MDENNVVSYLYLQAAFIFPSVSLLLTGHCCDTKMPRLLPGQRYLTNKLALKTTNQAATRTPEARMKVLPAALSAIASGQNMTGKQLRELRESLGLSQREFAVIIGVTRVTVTRAERDNPSRMVQSYIDQKLRAGELAIVVRQEPAQYGKKRSKKRS